MKKSMSGFTIVELLIVIVVIAILAAITIVAYNGIQTRASNTKRDADVTTYYKAILAARINTGKTLYELTTTTYSAGRCISSLSNPDGTEPRDLLKTHACWTTYYGNLSVIGQAAGMNLDSLRSGDSRGNPYLIDENETEMACPARDAIFSINPGSVSVTLRQYIPRYDGCS